MHLDALYTMPSTMHMHVYIGQVHGTQKFELYSHLRFADTLLLNIL